MPALSTLGGGPVEAGVNAAASTGVTTTASGSANTKGAWAQLISATAYDSQWLMIGVGELSGSLASYLLDIGIGGAGSEVVLIPDLAVYVYIATVTVVRYVCVPVAIPAGTRVAARIQASTGGVTANVSLHLIACGIDAPPGLHRVEACGALTAASTGTQLADPGGTANTDGAWTQLIAATGFDYRHMIILASNGGSYSSAPSHLLDIAVGGSGAEVEVVGDVWIVGPQQIKQSPAALSLPTRIEAGSRIAARHRCSSVTSGDRRLTVAVYGVG
jgi:hypothetical protein